MPNHETHEHVGLATVPVVAIGMYYFDASVATTAITSALYIAATYYLSPDLDHDVGAASYRRWGIFRFIWYPYQKIIKHRSWISHSGPISATIKLVYLLLWFLPILFFVPIDYLTHMYWYGILWIAVALSDTTHTVLDLIWKDT